jgi:hypothetical protein
LPARRESPRKITPPPEPITEPERVVEPQPVKPRAKPKDRPAPPKPAPRELIVLDLETRTQRADVTLSGPLRIARVNGAAHNIKSAGGSLAAGKAIVSLAGPRDVLLAVTLNDRRQLLIEPTVKTDDGDTIPFTTKTLTALQRRINKAGARAVRELEAMRGERARIDAWLNSRLVKPLADVRTATARKNELDVLIKEGEPVIKSMEAQAKIVTELVAFAEQLHGNAELVIESE